MLGLTNSTAPESINQPWCKTDLMKHVRWICQKKFQCLKILNPLILSRNFLGYFDRSLMLGLTNSTAPESINQPWCKTDLMKHVRWICQKKISVPKNSEPPDFESKFSGIFWSFTHAWFDEFNRAWVNKKKNQPWCKTDLMKHVRWICEKKFQCLKILNPLILSRNFLGFFDRSLMLGLTNSTAPESINQPWCKTDLMKHVRWICQKKFQCLKILNPWFWVEIFWDFLIVHSCLVWRIQPRLSQ